MQVWSAAKLVERARGDAISAQARSTPHWTRAAFQHPENTPIAILTSFARSPGKRASTGFPRHLIAHGRGNDRRRCDVDDTVEKKKMEVATKSARLLSKRLPSSAWVTLACRQWRRFWPVSGRLLFGFYDTIVGSEQDWGHAHETTVKQPMF